MSVPAGHWPKQAQGSLNQSLEFSMSPRGRGGCERPMWLPEGPGLRSFFLFLGSGHICSLGAIF